MGTSHYSLNLIHNKGVGGTEYFIDTPSWGPCHCSGFFTSNPGVVIQHKKFILFPAELNSKAPPMLSFKSVYKKTNEPFNTGVHIYFINIKISTFSSFCCSNNFTQSLLHWNYNYTVWYCQHHVTYLFVFFLIVIKFNQLKRRCINVYVYCQTHTVAASIHYLNEIAGNDLELCQHSWTWLANFKKYPSTFCYRMWN